MTAAEDQKATYALKNPGEVSEKERLDLQHQAWLLTFDGRLHKSALRPGTKSIVDIGAGGGSWALAMAREHPEVHVTATDLSPFDPGPKPPSNLTVQHQNADTEDWPFPEGSLDLVHGRMLGAGIKDWPRFASRAFQALAPGGGRLELSNASFPYRAAVPEYDSPEASPYIRLGQLMSRTWTTGPEGVDWFALDRLAGDLEAKGFVNVEEEVVRWPLGGWSEDAKEREIGKITLENFLRLFAFLGPAVLVKGGSPLPKEEAEEVTRAALDDLRENTEARKYYLNMKVHTATKP